MKVLGLISSPTDPASRARILQYGSYFSEKGIALHCKYFKPLKDADPKPWAKQLKKITGINEWRSTDLLKTIGRAPLLLSQSGFDLIWQNRLIQLQHSFWEKRLRKPVVFDLDDAIWLNEGRKHVEEKMQRAEMIFAGNGYLAEFAANHNKNIRVVPTVVDTSRLFPQNIVKEKFTIGWIGTVSNFQYLESIKGSLLEFLERYKDCELMIVSSVMPAFLPDEHTQIVFKEWSADTENELINLFSVGIMPLPDTEWTRGKCGYKLLQYLACGKPVIATPTGVNEEILKGSAAGIPVTSKEEWDSALERFRNEPAMAAAMGEKGREYVSAKYSCAAWADKIIGHMKSLL